MLYAYKKIERHNLSIISIPTIIDLKALPIIPSIKIHFWDGHSDLSLNSF